MKHDINLLLSLRERTSRKQNWTRVIIGVAVLLFLLVGIVWPQLQQMQRRSYLKDRQAYALLLAPIEERFMSAAANRNFRNLFSALVDEWADTPLVELDHVSKSLPSGARITGMALRNGTITIRGSATTDQEVVSFVGALRKINGYYGVKLLQSNQTDIGGVWEFTVEWHKADPNPSPTPAPTMLYDQK